MLLPITCVSCRRVGRVLCASCARALPRAEPFAPPALLASCAALLTYAEGARALVLALKYRNRRSLVAPLGAALADLLAPALLASAGTAPGPTGRIEVVTWAPTTPARRRARGFDQSRLLARAVAREADLPLRPLLVRCRGMPQTGRSLAERHAGPVFAAAGATPGCVLVVDDVITTGSTLSAAAFALLEGGSTAVHGLALARTPSLDKGPSGSLKVVEHQADTMVT